MRLQNIAFAVLSTALGIVVVKTTTTMLKRTPFMAFQAPARSIEASVDRVVSTADGPVVLLESEQSGRYLPIWIGYAEARAIERARTGTPTLRPRTHDLLAKTIAQLDARVVRVRVDRLRDDGVYTATVTLLAADHIIHIDARPSDSIALALRTSAPIYLDPSLRAEMIDPTN